MTNHQNHLHSTEKNFRYGIRKFKSGAASIAIASSFLFLTTPSVQALEPEALSVEVVSDKQEQDSNQISQNTSQETAPPQTSPRNVANLEFDGEGELSLTDEFSHEPTHETPPVTNSVIEPVTTIEQTAPSVQTTVHEIYTFTQAPFDIPVALVASSSPVEASIQTVTSNSSNPLSELEATANGHLVGQITTPGLHHLQISYTNQGGQSTTETITVHALEVRALKWARFFNAQITNEQVLNNVLVNLGNDTTIAPEQITKRVLTSLSDFPTSTERIEVEISLSNGLSTIVDATPIINRKPLIEAVETAARNKRLALSSNRELTREEKADLRATIEHERQATITGIQSSPLSQVLAIQTEGLKKLTAISLNSPSKTEARLTLTQLANEKKEALNRREDLTDEAKQAAQALLNRETIKLRDAIAKSQTKAEIAIVKRKAAEVIQGINPVADKIIKPVLPPTVSTTSEAPADEQALRDIINDEARKKRLALTFHHDLTVEEKNEARLTIERARQAALSNPYSAQELEALKAITLSSPLKTEARQRLMQLVEEKNAELEGRSDLTTATKQASQTRLKRELIKLQDAINKARTNSEVAIVNRYIKKVIQAIVP